MNTLLKHGGDWLIFLLLAVLFYVHPEYDIAFSQLFYDTQKGWLYAQNPLVQFFYHIVPPITVSLIVTLPLLVVGSLLKNAPQWLKARQKSLLYLLLVLLTGPGLLVNNLFKEHWDRARPHQVEAFGGNKSHTPAFYPANQCETNCSFVSGHASIGFYFIALYWLQKPRKKRLFLFGLTLGSLIGMARIMQGDHFLSDVIFSFFSVYFIAKYLAVLHKKYE